MITQQELLNYVPAEQAVSVKPLVWKYESLDYRKNGIGESQKGLLFEYFTARCTASNLTYEFIRMTKVNGSHKTELGNGKAVDGVNAAKAHFNKLHKSRILSAITTQPAAELDELRKKYAAACTSADGYKADLHASLERNDKLAAEARNAALQEFKAAHQCYPVLGDVTKMTDMELEATRRGWNAWISDGHHGLEILIKESERRDALQAKLDAATNALSTISVRMELTGDEMQRVARQALSAIKEGE